MRISKIHKLLIVVLLVLLIGSVLSASTFGQAPSSQIEEEITLNLTAYITENFLLTPSASIVIDMLAIDDAEEVTLIFGSPSKTLEITLTSPSGQQFSIGDPDTPTVSNIIFPDPTDPQTTGANYMFRLFQPEVGLWSYEVRETVTLTTPRAVLLSFLSTSPVRVGILGGDQDYRLDRDVQLGIVTVEGTNILNNVQISAELVNVNDPNFIGPVVNFRDDGLDGDEVAEDGLYTALFQPGVASEYQVFATIEGTNAQGNAFQRTASALFRVHPVRANLIGTFTDRSIDLDGNGLIDQIGVSPEIEILEAGQYNLVVTLEASNGNLLTANNIIDVTVGTTNPEVIFSAEGIRNSLGVDGPYVVREVYLELLDVDPPATADMAFNLGNTAPYQILQLEREAIELLPGGNAVGVDIDSNDKFDFLDVSLPVNFLNSGFYSWSARLVDANGTEVNLAGNSGFFNAGNATLSLRFNGRAIGENGVDGPYFVRNLIIFGAGESLSVDEVLTTAAFVASQFEGFIEANQPPTADANGPYEGNEGEVITLDASGSSDPDDNITLYEWDLDNDGEFDDATGVTTEVVFDDNGIFTVGLRVTDDFGESDTDTAEVTVNNVAPGVVADPTTQEVQYSDPIAAVTITATDVAADSLGATTSWSVNGGGFSTGLPDNLALVAGDCTVNDNANTCTWTLSGITNVAAGTYTVRITVSDDDGGQADTDIILTVLPEDATVIFSDNNPVAVPVVEDGGNSGPFSLIVNVSETQPDQPVDNSAPGDISLAVVSMSLVPVGPGGPVDGVCTPGAVSGSGYDSVLPITCSFDDVPVNTYTAQVMVSGGYYVGDGEDVLVVYDPSLGFATGGGWFYWPDTGERTNFGFTMKYNKKGQKVQGNLLLIRHLPDGSIYRVKSNALNGLALGENPEPPFGWASFSGKSTYQEPGWPEPEGNHEFLVYVEDRNDPGTGIDRFWIEVKDKNGNVIPASSMAREATDNAVELQGGNIVVPHITGGNGKK